MFAEGAKRRPRGASRGGPFLGLMLETLPGGVQGVPTGVRLGSTGGGTLNFGLTGAQLPPPGPSPSTEKERKRVDVYTRKYTLESIH